MVSERLGVVVSRKQSTTLLFCLRKAGREHCFIPPKKFFLKKTQKNLHGIKKSTTFATAFERKCCGKKTGKEVWVSG